MPRSGSLEPSHTTTVCIVNRRARELEGRSPRSRALLALLRKERPGLRIVETHSLADLEAAADAVAQTVPDAVMLTGGDGTYMAGVTALAHAFLRAGRTEGDLPAIALAPGGTANTVARNWGFDGGGVWSAGTRGAARYIARLLERLADGTATTTRRPTLRCDDGRGEKIGFIVGAGLVTRFFELYEDEGARGYRGAARIVARIFAGSLTGSALASRVLHPVPCLVEVDGKLASFDRTSLVCASVVRDLGLGLRLLYRAGEDTQRFHVVATALDSVRLGPQLPLVLAGRRLFGKDNVDALASSLHLRFDGAGASTTTGAYVLDGELFRAAWVRVTAGPVLRILSA